ELTVDTHCVDRERVIIPLSTINNIINFSSTSSCDTAYISESKIVGRSNINMRKEEPFRYNEEPYTLNTIFGDNHFLELFRFKALEGTLDLSAPDCAILSQACAQRMFGNESAIGKVLVYNDKKSVTVRGVIKQPLCKTSLNFDILLFNEGESGSIEFLQILPSVDLEAVNKVSNVLRRFKLQNGNYSPLLRSFEFVSLKDLYFKKPDNITPVIRPFLTFGSTDYLGILFIVAILLLFVGIMNFINLYMIYMMKRQKEYGIKKVYGLQKAPLFLQIWLENFLLAFWALMVAWLIIEITQVPVSQLMGVKMEYTPFDLYLSLGFLLLLPLLTSVYPYLRHQYMAPITSMRAIANSRQSVATRMMLLSVQYMVTFVLMVFSLYLNNHFRFLIDTPPGFRTENVLEATVIQDLYDNYKDYAASKKAIYQKLDECPDILAWTNSDNILLSKQITDKFYNDKDEEAELLQFVADESFFKVFDLKLIEGEIPENMSFRDSKVILNQAAMKALGYRHLEEAYIRSSVSLGMSIDENGKITKYGTTLFPASGIVEDYYFGHITEGVKPMAIQIDGASGTSIKVLIHIAQGKEKTVISYLKNAILEVYGNDTLEYSWISNQVKAIYDEDRRVATIYTIFALIGIGIACLGLFGISLFDIRRRFREIAIRKAHGAGMKDLYQLLFKKYLLILGISFVVATPIAYYSIRQYTADFAVKAPLGIGIFLIALLLVALISMGTLWWQIRKAANINPSIVMKRE
ncbi:MAG: FtsX-like permease family protein, partial [Bacteroidaceae bacterium]|nr:FtsX-like permease family protein [Bacteroidaceae bacterium]